MKQQSCGLDLFNFVLTSLVLFKKTKQNIKIVELENCYKGRKLSQSFLPLDTEVQGGLRGGEGVGEVIDGREAAVTPVVVARETWAPGLLRCLPLPRSIANICSHQMCESLD